MVAKNLGGVVPEPGEFSSADTELLATADGLLERVRAHFDAQAMHLALEAIWLMLGDANRYFSAEQPWVLRKSETESDQVRFRTVLYITCEVVRIAALLVQPVMPESAGTMLDLLGQAEDQRAFAALGARLAPGTALPAPTGVFPRYQPPSTSSEPSERRERVLFFTSVPVMLHREDVRCGVCRVGVSAVAMVALTIQPPSAPASGSR